jgi:hypothetical protein
MISEMIFIEPNETVLTGMWQFRDGRVVADPICRRIDELTKTYLLFLDNDGSGWERLFRDPTDNRLWELTFPQGEMQGGGPPRLQFLTPSEARKKYSMTD